MISTAPEECEVPESSDNVLEKSTLEEINVGNSKESNVSTTDGSKNKENSYSRRNSVKQICFFFMDHNYCRYGRNCRFSHVKPDSPEFLCSRNTGYQEHASSKAKAFPKSRNLKSRESFDYADESKTEVKNQEKGNENSTKQGVDTSDQHGDNTAYRRFGASTAVDRHPHRGNSHHSAATGRQRNLYFYRSSNRSTPSDPSGNGTQPSNHCRYFSKGFCRLGDSCKFLHQANDRCDNEEKNHAKVIEEKTLENGKNAVEASTSRNERSSAASCDKVQPQNCPAPKRLVNLQDADQNDIQRLRDIEIQQLKRRFPAHELIKSSPEEILHVSFCPSDPDWSFAVDTVPLEVVFSKEYPREACTIKVLEADNLPPILVWHLNKCISEWIKEKYQSCVSSGKVELLFRPFLRWFDRNIEELFLVGLRKVKQDLLAKAAGIEFVPYEELPGAFPKTSAARCAAGTTEYEKQDDCLSTTPQESDSIGLTENAEQSTESKNEGHVQHADDNNDAIHEKVNVVPESKADYTPTSAEKENFSPDLLDVKFLLNKEGEYPLSTNTSIDKFSVPKLGTEVKLLGLELREAAAGMVSTKIAVSLQCSRCKTRHEINTPPKRNNSLNCIKCHHSMQVVFQPAMLHQFSAVMGYLHLTECQAVDIPLMECNFIVDCLNCSKQITISGIHYGQLRVTWCLFCNKKMSIYAQSVKFHQLQPGADIVSCGNRLTTIVKKEKKVIRDPAIQEGKPLPDCGTCRHYKKSYRWLRFPCCGKTYPCDLCHDEKETDHEMKYANRMICGFCAKEQPYAGSKPCTSCSANMTKKAGAHWEGGKGCRDKITMSKEDHQKYAGMSKTTSRRAQNQKPNKK